MSSSAIEEVIKNSDAAQLKLMNEQVIVTDYFDHPLRPASKMESKLKINLSKNTLQLIFSQTLKRVWSIGRSACFSSLLPANSYFNSVRGPRLHFLSFGPILAAAIPYGLLKRCLRKMDWAL